MDLLELRIEALIRSEALMRSEADTVVLSDGGADEDAISYYGGSDQDTSNGGAETDLMVSDVED